MTGRAPNGEVYDVSTVHATYAYDVERNPVWTACGLSGRVVAALWGTTAWLFMPVTRQMRDAFVATERDYGKVNCERCRHWLRPAPAQGFVQGGKS